MLGFNRVISLVRARLSAISVAAVPSETYIVPGSDLYGNVFTRNVVLDVGGVPVDTQLVTPAVQVPAANSTTNISFLYALNAIGFEENLVVIPDNANGQAPHITGMLGVVARLQGWNGATFDRLVTQGDNADGVAVEGTGHLATLAHSGLFNGTTWDRERNHIDGTALAPAVRAVTTYSADIVTYNANDLVAFLNITAVPGVTTVQLVVDGKDPASGNYLRLGAGTVQVGVGLTGGNLAVLATNSNILPRIIRIGAVHSGAGNFTYSIGYSLSR